MLPFLKSPIRSVTVSFTICAALLGACSGDDGPDGGGNGPDGTVVPLAFCTPPDWVAIKDGSGPWQRVLPVGGAYEATFETGKGGIAVASLTSPSGGSVTVKYGVPSALAVHCAEGQAQVRGTVTGVVEMDRVQIDLANSHTFFSGPVAPVSFSLQFVPAGTWNLFGLRSNDFVAAVPKAIVRRGVGVPQPGDLAPLDFDGAEAFTLTAAQVTVTGIGPGGGTITSSYYDSDGWQHDIKTSDLSVTGSAGYVAFPLDRLETNELSGLYAFASDHHGYRGTYQFFRAPTDIAVAMGPVLDRPAVTFPDTSPYLRPLARVASQAEYGDVAEAQFLQSSHFASVEVSAAYLGRTPVTWQLEFPDFSGVDGWDNAWGPDPASVTNWFVRAAAGAVPSARSQLHEGDRYEYAVQGSDAVSIKAALESTRARNR